MQKYPDLKDITIKECMPDEVSRIRDLIHTVIKECYPKVYPQSVVKYFLFYHDSLHTLENIENGYTIALYYKDKLIASGNLKEDSIGGVYVLPEYQKRGYAKIIVERLLDKARKQELKKVILDSTLIAKKLYDSLGFTTVEEMSMEMENGEMLDYYHMEIEL